MIDKTQSSAAIRSTIERVEVWADGERLSRLFVTVKEAEQYAAVLNTDWRTIEIVTIRREVRRVR